MKKLLILMLMPLLAIAQGTLTDRDGNQYHTVTIGDYEWTTSNSKLKTYNDGTPIPFVSDRTAWANLKTGAWCYFNNDPTTEEKMGILYNWYALYHITQEVANPSDQDNEGTELNPASADWTLGRWNQYIKNNEIVDGEWNALNKYLINSPNFPQGVAKSLATNEVGWWQQSTDPGAPGNNITLNNASAFNAIPSGLRNQNGDWDPIGFRIRFWYKNNYNSIKGNTINIYYANADLYPEGIPFGCGLPIRFVRSAQKGLSLNNLKSSSFKIFPNPAKDQITIDCANLSDVLGWTYQIVTPLGQSLTKGEIKKGPNNIQLNAINGQGIYFIKIYDHSNNLKETKKIMIQ